MVVKVVVAWWGKNVNANATWLTHGGDFSLQELRLQKRIVAEDWES